MGVLAGVVCGGNCFSLEMFEILTFGGILLAANVDFCGKILWRENSSYLHFSYFLEITLPSNRFPAKNARHEHFFKN